MEPRALDDALHDMLDVLTSLHVARPLPYPASVLARREVRRFAELTGEWDQGGLIHRSVVAVDDAFRQEAGPAESRERIGRARRRVALALRGLPELAPCLRT